MDDSPAESLGDYTAALQGFRRNYYDVWNPEAREALWRRMEEGLFRKGVDAWWLDATEPNLWSLQGAYHMYQTCLGPAARRLNAYTLAHSKSIYEHQRQTDETKRVFILADFPDTDRGRVAVFPVRTAIRDVGYRRLHGRSL